MIGIRNRFGFGENRITVIIEQHRRMAQEHRDSAKNDQLARMEHEAVEKAGG